MSNPETIGDATGVVNVLSCATTPRTADRLAVVVQLQGDADHLAAALHKQGGCHGAIDPTGHRYDHACSGGNFLGFQHVHGLQYIVTEA